MTTPRSVIVNREITRFYHVISRCVRRAHLCGDGKDHCKDWLETRPEELAGIFAIDVCGYAILDNHLHLLVQLGEGAPDRAWSAAEVARRWARLFPFRGPEGRPVDPPDEWIERRVRDEGWIETVRDRLSDLGAYLDVVDWMARMPRPGKAALAPSTASILERIGIALEPLRQRVTALVARARMVGTVAGGRGAARAVALQRGVPWVKNLWGALA